MHASPTYFSGFAAEALLSSPSPTAEKALFSVVFLNYFSILEKINVAVVYYFFVCG